MLLKKVIVCDDQDDVAHLINMAFGDAGYLCLRARDGGQAVALAATEAPDLLILDVMMPQVDGLTACRQLKADPLLSRIPILMLTALGDVDDKIKGLEAGADDYLSKPFDLRELMARARALIRGSRRERDRSAVTHLPGPAALEEAVEARLAAGEPFALAHAELAGYDAFAGVHGLREAESLVAAVGGAIARAAQSTVVTHLGGDDFALVVPAERLGEVTRAITAAVATAVAERGGPPVTLIVSAVASSVAGDVDGLARALATERLRPR